jgi:hypothetical protein
MTTPNPTTPEVLARLRALHAAASPAPWDSIDDVNAEMVTRGLDEDGAFVYVADVWGKRDTALIVAMRNALPALFDEVERLRARLHHECDGCPGCGSNDCPDALDVAEAEVAKLRASLTTARPLGGTP